MIHLTPDDSESGGDGQFTDWSRMHKVYIRYQALGYRKPLTTPQYRLYPIRQYTFDDSE